MYIFSIITDFPPHFPGILNVSPAYNERILSSPSPRARSVTLNHNVTLNSIQGPTSKDGFPEDCRRPGKPFQVWEGPICSRRQPGKASEMWEGPIRS